MDQQHSKTGSFNFDKRVWIVTGILALTITLLAVFKVALGSLMLVLTGILLAVYLLGCASLLEKLRIPYKLSVVLSVLLNVALLVGFFWFVGARIQSQVAELSQKIPQSIAQIKEAIQQSPLGQKALDLLSFSGGKTKTLSLLKQFFSSTFGILSDVYIILLFAIFFTASPGTYKKGLIKLIPPSGQDKTNKILATIHKKFKSWILGRIIGFFIISIFTGVSLWILGMPLVLTLALIAGILNFIPNFGPIIALIPAVLLALLQGFTMVPWVIALYTVVQIIQSAVTLPLITKKMVNVPPILVLFAQVVLGIIIGFWGLLMAIPVIIIIMTIVKKVYLKEGEEKAE